MEEEQSEIKALIKVWLKVLISLIYTYFIVSKLPKGKTRFLSLLPILTLFILLPLSLSNPTIVGLTGLFFSWLANFKLVLFSFNQGPLSHNIPKKSFLNFMLIAALPVKIKYSKSVDPDFGLNFGSRLLVKSLMVVASLYSNYYNKNLHPQVLLLIYSFTFYLYIEIILDLCKAIVGSIIAEVDLHRPFNEPYLSTSLQVFWGKRWNLVVSDLMRHAVYVPMRSFWEARIGKRWAPHSAMMATFVVSGLMHEIVLLYISRATPTWELTCFFLLHGLCLLAEIGLKRYLNWIDLHWALSGPLTFGFVMASGFWLFFPQLLRYQVFLFVHKP